MAHGYADGIIPEAFAIVNGKLYLNLTRGINNAFLARAGRSIAAGDKVWPGLRERLGKKRGYWTD